ncbi:S8 family peptidase [Hymenobacter koreensis]|uniref:Peptidase S8/S53 domain-containing protein n=1 Tax=Hymenobacter koreensis TaxID=1084523 RepID=A0ABP8JH93_9BACT
METTNNTSRKRYIVTYVDQNADFARAEQILHVQPGTIKDGVSLLESDKPLTAKDVLHFDGLGSSSVVLSETEAKNLRRDDQVLAVEEDLEVHALGVEDLLSVPSAPASNGGTQYYDLNDSNVYDGQLGLDGPTPQPVTNAPDQGFQAGYQQALTDTYSRMLGQLNAIFGVAPAAAGPVPSPVPVRPIIPVRPILPPLTPPIFQQPIPWNIAMVKAPQAWPRTRGRGIKVAVLDTGIASHPDLIISGGASFVPGVTSYHDGHGHGTHCAGIIGARNNFLGVVGVAPQCNVYAVKVLNDAGSGQLSWILAGMAWARQNGMQVVSMSLGSNSGPVVAYTIAVQQLLAMGCVVVAAAGNNGPAGTVGAPANSPGVIAVGAVDQHRVIAPFSSRGGTGNQVTISAPGVSVNSTHLSNGYRSMSGTSMACPHVAGAAALVRMRYPTWTPAQITRRLVTTASDLGFPGNDTTYGAGLLNCDAATM